MIKKHKQNWTKFQQELNVEIVEQKFMFDWLKYRTKLITVKCTLTCMV